MLEQGLWAPALGSLRAGMPDDARRREMLYQHDLGVSRVRQILTRAAKSQVEAELEQTAG